MTLETRGFYGIGFSGCGACHGDDVAVAILAFEKYGLRKGVHYDYGDEDGYHLTWCCNYIHPKTKDALGDIDNYNQILLDSFKAIPYMGGV